MSANLVAFFSGWVAASALVLALEALHGYIGSRRP